MPSASVSMAVSVKTGDNRICRKAYEMSWRRVCITALCCSIRATKDNVPQPQIFFTKSLRPESSYLFPLVCLSAFASNPGEFL